MNRIVINGKTYAGNNIREAQLNLVESLTGDLLHYDTMTFVIDSSMLKGTLFIPRLSGGLVTSDGRQFTVWPAVTAIDGSIAAFEYGDTVCCYHDDRLLGKFYVSSVTRKGGTKYKVECISAVGLLANLWHYGGVYEGVTAANLFADVIGGAIEYTLDSFFAEQKVYGWLPIDTRRNNLQQLLFALSASVKKDAEGNVYITGLSGESVIPVPTSRVLKGGSVEYPQAATKIVLSEHSYIARDSDLEVTLYEGEITAELVTAPSGAEVLGAIIKFDAPAHDLSSTGTNIVESGINYAVLSPSSECLLVGKLYSHTVRQVIRPELEEDTSDVVAKEITVDNATLVSVANSEGIANRLQSFYGSAKTITTNIVVEDERPGVAVQIQDPFGEATEGIISAMHMKLSGVLAAECEICAGYELPGPGNYYTNVDVLTKDGEWIVPDGVERIRAVLIGGGQGGWSGERGRNGYSPYGVQGYVAQVDIRGGEGGAGGKGGHGGNIYIVTIDVTAGDKIPVSIGIGGEGGICTPDGAGEGAEGTATTFGNHSSDSGTVSSFGYVEMFNSVTYGGVGKQGIYTGGKGGNGSGYKDGNGSPGEDVTIDGITYTGGKGGTPDKTTGGGLTYYEGGGGGGGAAPGGNGKDGKSRSSTGAAGADATIPGADDASFGFGGTGGNGGGGGGGGGYMNDYRFQNWQDVEFWHSGFAGPGGLGSQGGKGGDGVVLVYY